MKYLLLIYGAEDASAAPGSPEFDAYMAGYVKADETYKADGVFEGGEALESPQTATSVRVRGGKTETMDGPFAETKEQLGGYYLIEAENLDEAVAWAAKIPSCPFGTIEVRPVMVFG